MATWSIRANGDMEELVRQEGAAAVASIRAPISTWADTVAGRGRREFQGSLRFPVYAEVIQREIITIEHD